MNVGVSILKCRPFLLGVLRKSTRLPRQTLLQSAESWITLDEARMQEHNKACGGLGNETLIFLPERKFQYFKLSSWPSIPIKFLRETFLFLRTRSSGLYPAEIPNSVGNTLYCNLVEVFGDQIQNAAIYTQRHTSRNFCLSMLIGNGSVQSVIFGCVRHGPDRMGLLGKPPASAAFLTFKNQ
jgi:hypothetical protein